jgi:hypothetical protein
MLKQNIMPVACLIWKFYSCLHSTALRKTKHLMQRLTFCAPDQDDMLKQNIMPVPCLIWRFYSCLHSTALLYACNFTCLLSLYITRASWHVRHCRCCFYLQAHNNPESCSPSNAATGRHYASLSTQAACAGRRRLCKLTCILLKEQPKTKAATTKTNKTAATKRETDASQPVDHDGVV